MDARRAPLRIVAAVSHDVRQRIRAILPGSELRFVETDAELMEVLQQARCDILILGMQFDESSAVASLERVRSRGKAFPVVCVRGRPSLLGQRSMHALRTALHELGAQDFIDLMDYPDNEAGNARVRALLERVHLL